LPKRPLASIVFSSRLSSDTGISARRMVKLFLLGNLIYYTSFYGGHTRYFNLAG
jgi:hypothetical protein